MLSFLLASLLVLPAKVIDGGLIQHSDKATSYQSFTLEHHHAVPTYVKKEHQQYLEHPVSNGITKSKVEVHHGDKHDPGYAITDIQNEQGYGGEALSGTYEVPEAHGELSLEAGHGVQYQVQDNQGYHQAQEVPLSEGHHELSQGHEYQQLQQGGEDQQQSYGHFLELANAALAQAYQHQGQH